MSDRRVVITGLGTVNPLANDVESFWQAMLAGKSGVAPITYFDTTDYDSKIAGEVKDYAGPPTDLLSLREAKRLDPYALFAVGAAIEAVADSGIDFGVEDVDRCGVIVGSGIGGLIELENQTQRMLEKGPGKMSAFTIPKLMGNAASGNISLIWGLRGPTLSVVTACASAGHSVADAMHTIQRGECDVIITGGSEASVCRVGVGAFCALKGLSTRNDDPATASRPWDAGRDGFVIAEGAGCLVLEELEHAKARGARIYGELLSAGVSSDAHHITAPHPEGTGAAMAMARALKGAGIEPTEVDYINAHGTSTQLGDIAETMAVKQVFGDAAAKVMISSTKSFIGHSLGASGGIELVAVSKALAEGVVPHTLNLQDPSPECDLDYVPGEPRQKSITVAMSNSFGFGGHNVSLVVRKLVD